MKKIAIILATLLTVACSTTNKTDSAPASQANSQNTASPATASVSAVETAERKLAAELLNLQKESVFFDFDKSAVKPAYQDAITKQADFIKNHKNDIVTLEGNADERGSNKYNQALGERRALAVKHSLQALGIPAAQIKTISHGEEKPRLTCHEEKCWKENRRVDFVHSIK